MSSTTTHVSIDSENNKQVVGDVVASQTHLGASVQDVDQGKEPCCQKVDSQQQGSTSKLLATVQVDDDLTISKKRLESVWNAIGFLFMAVAIVAVCVCVTQSNSENRYNELQNDLYLLQTAFDAKFPPPQNFKFVYEFGTNCLAWEPCTWTDGLKEDIYNSMYTFVANAIRRSDANCEIQLTDPTTFYFRATVIATTAKRVVEQYNLYNSVQLDIQLTTDVHGSRFATVKKARTVHK